MTPILLNGPAAEPVTLSEAKSWLRVEHAAEDDLIGALVTSARLIVESVTRRMLMTQTWRLSLDRWPQGLVFTVPLAPLQNVAAIRTLDAAGVATVLPTTAYSVDPRTDGGRILFVATPAAPARLIAGVEIDVVVGYGDTPADVPAPLRQAILMLAAHWYDNRGDAPQGVDAVLLPAPVAALAAPFRRARLS